MSVLRILNAQKLSGLTLKVLGCPQTSVINPFDQPKELLWDDQIEENLLDHGAPSVLKKVEIDLFGHVYQP